MVSLDGDALCITGPLGGESIGQQLIPLTKDHWCRILGFLELGFYYVIMLELLNKTVTIQLPRFKSPRAPHANNAMDKNNRQSAIDNICKSKNRKISNLRRTKSPNLNVSRPIVQLSLPNPMKPCVKSRMKMQLEQLRQAMLQLILSERQFYCLLRCVLY